MKSLTNQENKSGKSEVMTYIEADINKNNNQVEINEQTKETYDNMLDITNKDVRLYIIYMICI